MSQIQDRKLSPLIQGGLEILSIVTIERDFADGIRKFEGVNFPVGEDEEYKDESGAILRTIGTEEYKDSDCNMWRVFLLYTFSLDLVFLLVKNSIHTYNFLLSWTNLSVQKLTRVPF